jgi:hypothetical protein
MKTKLAGRVLMLGAVVGATTSTSFGRLLLYEPFDYTASSGTSLAGQTNSGTGGAWAKAGTQTNDPKVITGSLSYSGLPTSTTANSEAGQLNNNGGAVADRIDLGMTGDGFGGLPPGYTFYYSMLLDATSLGAASSAGFLGGLEWETAASGNGSQDAAAALCIQKTSSTSYQLGIAYKDSATKVFDTAHNYSANQTLFVVVKFVEGTQNNDDAAYLYVNPNPLGSEPVSANASSSNDGSAADYGYNTDASGFARGGDPTIGFIDDLHSFELRNLSTFEPSRTTIDEIRVGTTWGEAVGQVPEPTGLGLLVLAGFAGRIRRGRRS